MLRPSVSTMRELMNFKVASFKREKKTVQVGNSTIHETQNFNKIKLSKWISTANVQMGNGF